MRTIDVHDLPDSIAQALADTVKTLREQFSKKRNGTPPDVPAWPLGCSDSLNRGRIYDDHLGGKLDAGDS